MSHTKNDWIWITVDGISKCGDDYMFEDANPEQFGKSSMYLNAWMNEVEKRLAEGLFHFQKVTRNKNTITCRCEAAYCEFVKYITCVDEFGESHYELMFPNGFDECRCLLEQQNPNYKEKP